MSSHERETGAGKARRMPADSREVSIEPRERLRDTYHGICVVLADLKAAGMTETRIYAYAELVRSELALEGFDVR